MTQTAMWIVSINNNSNNDFLRANIHEVQAQWRDKTKGLSNLVNNARVVNGWMKIKRTGSIKA